MLRTFFRPFSSSAAEEKGEIKSPTKYCDPQEAGDGDGDGGGFDNSSNFEDTNSTAIANVVLAENFSVYEDALDDSALIDFENGAAMEPDATEKNNPNIVIGKNHQSDIRNVDDIDEGDLKQHSHGLQEGDHIIRWKMLGYCWPIQIHGIVISAGPDIVTIVDCGLTNAKKLDRVGQFIDDEYIDEERKESSIEQSENVEKSQMTTVEPPNGLVGGVKRSDTCGPMPQSANGISPRGKESRDKCQSSSRGIKQERGKKQNRLNVLTLVDEKEIQKWSKVIYGEEVHVKGREEISWGDRNCRPTRGAMTDEEDQSQLSDMTNQCRRTESDILTSPIVKHSQQSTSGNENENFSSSDDPHEYSEQNLFPTECLLDDLVQEENNLLGPYAEPSFSDNDRAEKKVDDISKPSEESSLWCFFNEDKKQLIPAAKKNTHSFDRDGEQIASCNPKPEKSKGNTESQCKTALLLPKSDPPCLVLARVRFLLEYGEEEFPPSDKNATNSNEGNKNESSLLPPHHLLYANSECIAVWCKTGKWSTLQGSLFLHSSTLGNAKQTATLAMFLSAQTVTVPAPGIWGFFGGTTTVSLFSTQPWIVPALVGGGMVYVGLPIIVLWKAKGRWGATERKLNEAFWSMADPEIIVELIQLWSSLEA